MIKSDFNYTPNVRISPCWNEVECKTKQQTCGRCRNYCEDYIKYQALMDQKREAGRDGYVENCYKRENINRMNRRYA